VAEIPNEQDHPTQSFSFSNKSLEVDLRGVHMGKEKEKGKNSRGGGQKVN
jgi:hypothetical protein